MIAVAAQFQEFDQLLSIFSSTNLQITAQLLKILVKALIAKPHAILDPQH